MSRMLTNWTTGQNSGSSYWTPEYQTVYNAFIDKPNSTVKTAQQKLVKRLVDAGIWTKRDVFYMFAQTTNGASEALKNWIDPTRANATLVNAPTFTALKGFTGALAGGKHIDTNYNPATYVGAKHTVNSNCTMIGVSTNGTTDRREFGAYEPTGWRGCMMGVYAGSNVAYASNYSGPKTYSNSDPGLPGYFGMSRNVNDCDYYNGYVHTLKTDVPNGAIYNGNFYVLDVNRNGAASYAPTDRQVNYFASGGYLTPAEISEEIDAVEEYMYSIGGNIYPYTPKNDLVLTTNGELTVSVDIEIFNNSAPVIIDWGDGTNQKASFTDILQGLTRKTHTYTSAVPYTVTISHANSISKLIFGYDFASNFEGDIARLNCCGAIEEITLYNFEKQWYGDATGLSKTLKKCYLGVVGTEDCIITCDWSEFSALEYLYAFGPQTGNITNITTPNLVHISLGDQADIKLYIDITNMQFIKNIDSYAQGSRIGGNVGTCPQLEHICDGTLLNDYYGNIALCSEYKYLDNTGGGVSGGMYGDISNLTHAYRFQSYNCINSFTGTLPNAAGLQSFICANDNSNITQPTRLNTFTQLGRLVVDTWTFTAIQLNQLLADVWANRNAVKGGQTTEREMHFHYNSSAAPTGQGITDRDALRLYRSPTPPGTAALWTILTN
jgi:hypothetical protein